ncbi:MAG: hypothetical protein AB7T49_01385 [Oligoflexales bacterium]
MKAGFSVLAICLVALSAVGSDDAYAYIDPGTGSLALQMIIAGLLSGMFAIKMFWARLKDQFKRIFGSNKQ